MPDECECTKSCLNQLPVSQVYEHMTLHPQRHDLPTPSLWLFLLSCYALYFIPAPFFFHRLQDNNKSHHFIAADKHNKRQKNRPRFRKSMGSHEGNSNIFKNKQKKRVAVCFDLFYILWVSGTIWQDGLFSLFLPSRCCCFKEKQCGRNRLKPEENTRKKNICPNTILYASVSCIGLQLVLSWNLKEQRAKCSGYLASYDITFYSRPMAFEAAEVVKGI